MQQDGVVWYRFIAISHINTLKWSLRHDMVARSRYCLFVRGFHSQKASRVQFGFILFVSALLCLIPTVELPVIWDAYCNAKLSREGLALDTVMTIVWVTGHCNTNNDNNNNGPNGHLFYVSGDLMMRRGMLPIIMLPDGDLRIALHLVPFWILTIWGNIVINCIIDVIREMTWTSPIKIITFVWC